MSEVMEVEQYVDIEAEDFLELVWGDREGWVDLPAKVGKYWVPFYTKWPEDKGVTLRIDSSLRDREDLYYSVAQFAERGRKIEDVLPTHWLWADLDEVHPTAAAKLGLLPTVAVESSPGRYQALWRLTREVSPRNLELLNRSLSYALDADRGGWDLTQVLRIPGTRNFKYPDAPVVRVLWIKEDLAYAPKKVWRVVKEHAPAAVGNGGGVVLPKRAISGKAKALLKTGPENVVEGERSARLWELECLLAESGLGEDEIFDLVRGTPWNKWRGSGDAGRRRLRADIRKAVAHVTRRASLKRGERGERDDRRGELERGDKGRKGVVDRDSDVASDGEADPGAAGGSVEDGGRGADGDESALPWVGYSTFMAMAMEEPRWLIENIWTADSHGFLAGEPKTNKTTLALCLALSVASGAPFLNRYAVGVTGPVLMVQEENAPWMMQDRLRKIATYYGLISTTDSYVRPAGAGALGSVSVDLDFPTDVPLKLLNNYGFDLGVEEHRDLLEAEVAELQPKLVILDPMYLIFPADANSASDLRPFLQWVIQLRYTYGCAVMIIHHMRKENLNASGQVRAGQRILGSTILHGFSDSAIYTSFREEEREGWVKVALETEFRSMAPQKGVEIALSMGSPGSLLMEAEIEQRSLEAVIRDIVEQSPGVTVRKLSETLSLDKRTVLSRIRGASETEFVVKGGKRGRGHSWKVYLKGAEGGDGESENSQSEDGED